MHGPGRPTANAQTGDQTGRPVKPPRKVQRLYLSPVTAAERGNIAAPGPAGTDHKTCRSEHRITVFGVTDQATPRRGEKFVLDVNSESCSQRSPRLTVRFLQQLPVVLNIQRVVIVSQMNLIGLRRGPSTLQEQENAAVYGSKRQIVIDRGKDLVCQSLRIKAVNFCPKELPPELHVMIAKKFVRVGRERRVFLVQI